MKRTIVFMLALSVLLTAAACRPAGDSVKETPAPTEAVQTACTAEPTAAETETPNKNDISVMDFDSAYCNSGIQQIIAANNSIYFTCEKYDEKLHTTYAIVYFSDKEYKEWMPLCSRPDCMHNNKDCNAVLEDCASLKMWLYGDHIYYMLNEGESAAMVPELWRMKLDGTDHERLKVPKLTLDGDAEYDGYSSGIRFHNAFDSRRNRKEVR